MGAAADPWFVAVDPDHDVVGRRLRILDLDVGEGAIVEDAGVGELVLGVSVAPPGVLGDEVGIGIGGLGIPVERPEPGRGWRRIEPDVDLLDVLAVIALRPGQPEQPLLEDGIAFVPEGDREAQAGVLVTDPEEPVLAPAIGARPGVVVRQGGPRLPIGRVVLADGPPLAVGQVRPPAPPRGDAFADLSEPLTLGIGSRVLHRSTVDLRGDSAMTILAGSAIDDPSLGPPLDGPIAG